MGKAGAKMLLLAFSKDVSNMPICFQLFLKALILLRIVDFYISLRKLRVCFPMDISTPITEV